ncbi:hypothetical protein SLA2020_461260 [Shorea laevis]
MLSRYLIEFLLVVLAVLGSCSAATIDYDANALIINGQRKIIIAGAIHYPRSTPEMWPDLIQKAKDGGIDTIETYIFWNLHEPRRREYDFTGNLDFVKFFQLVQQAGLYGILRIGPYVCAEWNYGGFPMWLHNTPGIQLRTDNDIYKQEMQIFTTKIVNIAKEAKLFASQGGPIILAQIENEYGNIMDGYGDAGKKYINWCAQMAVAQNIGVPWIMCQQDNAPQPMINTCNGFYCDQFKPNNAKSPKMWTENWTGWFKAWGGKDPHRTAEDVAFAVARFYQNGGILQNYYMYHGGTNFGRTSGGPYITTSYDYDAPLDEYGNLNQPKYGHLKQLHAALKLGESFLTSGNVTWKSFGNGVDLATFTNSSGARFCMLSNIDKSKDANIDLEQGRKYFVPAWSVSFLDGCNKEIYNTAKLNTQISMMVKRIHNKEDRDVDGDGDGDAQVQQAPQLNWEWSPEAMKDTLQGKGRFKAGVLLDQKSTTFDISDYFWYMTSVNINETIWKSWNWKNATLRISTNGHALFAYVNRKLIGYQFSKQANTQQMVNGDDYSFVFEEPAVKLKLGANTISILSVTVGLANYGAKFDLKPTGLIGGSVQLVNNGQDTIDLTSSTWFYKVGLNGEVKRLYDPNSTKAKWFAEKLPFGRPMTWYKTTFQAPAGTDPVVVDLQGMGKGYAWVNGHNLGRYWPTEKADGNGCTTFCDYRGQYNNDKCRTNCGNPTQRYYHVPRSFLNNNGTNTLILFEEIGGNTSAISFQIITVGKVCGHAYLGNTLELSCQGGKEITDIEFASFGDPQGSCGSFKVGSYQATNALAAVEKACIGRQSCGIEISDATFELNNDIGVTSRLAVQAVCS